MDARLISGRSGGVEQAIIGLADSFSSLNDPEIEFNWLVYKNESSWLSEHLPKNSDVVETRFSHESKAVRTSLIHTLRGSRWTQRSLTAARKYGPWAYKLPAEPEIVSKINPSIVHFPTQFGFTTAYPNVYQPHDLQHLHFPEFFSREILYIRQIAYEAMIKQATKVIVGNDWTKKDVQRHFPIARGKVTNVPVFPQILPSPSEQSVSHFNFSNRGYLFYPAAGWIHKNHDRLFRALATVLKAGHEIDLVLSGTNLEANPSLLKGIQDNELQGHVHIVGFVSPLHLLDLYKRAHAIIVPSLFESASFPIWEAFNLGIPVAAARTTAIPDQVGDAATLFNPLSVTEISTAIVAVLRGGAEIETRVQRGKTRVSQFTAKNTATGFRYSYRRSLDLPLDDMDLEWECEGTRF